jgi:hypothetical protein
MACWHHPVEYGWADVWTPWDRPQTIQQEGNYVFTRVCSILPYKCESGPRASISKSNLRSTDCVETTCCKHTK